MDRGESGLWPMNQDLSIAIRNQSEILNKISSERINVEFSKIIAGKHCSQIVEKMLNDGVLPIFSPLDPINCYTAVRIEYPDTLKLSTEARISMLFSNLDQDKLSKFLRDMKTSNEFRKKCLLLHSLIGNMPDSTIESSRVHKHILGPNGFEHLIIQKIISEYNIQTLSSSEIDSNEVLSAIERYHSIPSKVALPLLDGEYLMRTTGIPSGKKLGCLKDWLFRLQVERSITSFEKMESLLCSLPWTTDNFEQWPKMIFPKSDGIRLIQPLPYVRAITVEAAVVNNFVNWIKNSDMTANQAFEQLDVARNGSFNAQQLDSALTKAVGSSLLIGYPEQ